MTRLDNIPELDWAEYHSLPGERRDPPGAWLGHGAVFLFGVLCGFGLGWVVG